VAPVRSCPFGALTRTHALTSSSLARAPASYTAFYVLYPLGAGSEAVLLLKSAGPAKAAYGALAGAWVYFVVCAWPPSALPSRFSCRLCSRLESDDTIAQASPS